MSAKGTHLLQRDYVRGGSIYLIAGEWGVAWRGRATRLAQVSAESCGQRGTSGVNRDVYNAVPGKHAGSTQGHRPSTRRTVALVRRCVPLAPDP